MLFRLQTTNILKRKSIIYLLYYTFFFGIYILSFRCQLTRLYRLFVVCIKYTETETVLFYFVKSNKTGSWPTLQFL